ncbi:MAG: acetylxylan esterase [Acidobacteria bacterium]|nr:acetylxylan esterase [Acidobacteriota bacterium]
MTRLACLLLLAVPAIHAADIPALDPHLAKTTLHERQAMVEAQIHLAGLVKPLPAIADKAQWEAQAAEIRQQVLANVVFRGEAAKWRELPLRVEWSETIPSDGYRLRKFRYEVAPGMWVPGLLYEPARLEGKVPVVLNLNGHEGEGVAIPYIQTRCIHLARNGVLAYNFDWFGKGHLSAAGYDHYRMNQLDLTGTSGLAPFFLAQQRLLEIALQHANADPSRLAVTGLSGGGWQTMLLSSLDPRVKLASPVAGYSSFVTRAQFPNLDLGDSEQTPVDLGVYADYTHLTAMLAPRPTLMMNNALDNCCFRADYAPAPLLVAARPFFALYGQSGSLRHHANFDPGHNYGQDNRQALYRFLKEHFFAGAGTLAVEETAEDAQVRTAAELRGPFPEQNETFHTLALKLSEGLPRDASIPESAEAQRKARERLRAVVRWPDYTATPRTISTSTEAGMTVRAHQFMIGDTWTVPALEFSLAGSRGTTIVMGDAGKAALGAEIRALLESGQRVVAVDPFYFGESRIAERDFLFALLASALGERPLGIQSAQVAAVARALKSQYGAVSLAAFGPRTSLIALVAAAVETDAIESVRLVRPMRTLREPIEKDMKVSDAPELFCFGLLQEFDLPQLTALVRPRAVVAE